jgi:hypothetical protein
VATSLDWSSAIDPIRCSTPERRGGRLAGTCAALRRLRKPGAPDLGREEDDGVTPLRAPPNRVETLL